MFHVLVRPASKLDQSGLERTAPRCRLIETGARCDNQRGTQLALNFCEQCESFRRDFRIRQNIFDCGELRFRQEKRVWLPVEQTFIDQLLRMNARAEDPDRPVNLGRNDGDQKCLRRLDHVRELHRPLRRLAFSKLARNGPGFRDDL